MLFLIGEWIIEYNKWNLSDFQSHHPLRLLLMHFDYINYEEEVITFID